MTHLPRWSPLAKKEARELATVWLACIVVLAGAALERSSYVLLNIAMTAYVVGAVALGAQSMGQEYNHRTLTMLLSQPVRRERLAGVKLGVLAVMLLTLAGAAAATMELRLSTHAGYFLLAGNSRVTTILVLPVLGGFFLAPWMTMVSRRALSGVFFTFAIPAVIWTATEIVGVAKFGLSVAAVADVDRLKIDVLWSGTVAVCAVGGLMSWRTFMRLEAIEGGGADLHLPRWLVRRRASDAARTMPRARRSHAVWMLMRKEVRLQQMTFVLTGLYLLVSFSLWMSQRGDLLFVGATYLYGGGVALLIGASASAEERQLGTLEWQMLLPMSARTQWAVKAATSFALAALLAFALPIFMLRAAPWEDVVIHQQQVWTAAGAITLLTVFGLYVSSFSANALRAILVAGAAMPLGIASLNRASARIETSVFGFVMRAAPQVSISSWPLMRLTVLVSLSVSVGFCFLLLRFGLANHRYAERRVSRVLAQVTWLIGYLAFGVILLHGLSALWFWSAAAPR